MQASYQEGKRWSEMPSLFLSQNDSQKTHKCFIWDFNSYNTFLRRKRFIPNAPPCASAFRTYAIRCWLRLNKLLLLSWEPCVRSRNRGFDAIRIDETAISMFCIWRNLDFDAVRTSKSRFRWFGNDEIAVLSFQIWCCFRFRMGCFPLPYGVFSAYHQNWRNRDFDVLKMMKPRFRCCHKSKSRFWCFGNDEIAVSIFRNDEIEVSMF